MEARQYKNNVVFGICNENFTQFRKMRYFDSKVIYPDVGIYIILTIILKKGVICLERDLDTTKEPETEETPTPQ